MHPRELVSHVGSGLLNHALELGFVANRLQIGIAFGVIPAELAPTLINGLPEGGQCRLGLPLQRLVNCVYGYYLLALKNFTMAPSVF